MEDIIYEQAVAKFRCSKCEEVLVVIIDKRFFGRGQPRKCPYCDHYMKVKNG